MARSPNADLESMSDAQIRELIEHARGVIGDRFSNRVDEWRLIAHEAGYELTVTKLGERETRRRRRRGDSSEAEDRRGSVAPKYRNPENHSETWTGRGREPRWMTDLVKQGRSREELLISKEGSSSQKAEPAEAET